MKKQKEEIKSAADELQVHIIKLEHTHYDLEWYGCHLCVCVEDIPVGNDETADKVIKNVRTF